MKLLHACVGGSTMFIVAVLCGCLLRAQAADQPVNDRPNPYRLVDRWLTLPPGRVMGSTSAVDVDRDGHSMWVADRCGAASCADSMLAPILKIDADGKVVRSFGAGLFVVPHGLYVDRAGNVWVADASDGTDAGRRKGHQVFKFSPDGTLLMTLGKAGVTGNGPDAFNRPTDVVVASNGDVFVSDGHGGNSNARIVKFSSDGRFIKEWGRKGSAPGTVTAFIPDPTPNAELITAAEGVAVDAAGNVYGAVVVTPGLKKYVRK